MLNDEERELLGGVIAKPNLDESLDRASRFDPDEYAISSDLPISHDTYQAFKPEVERKKRLAEINPEELKESYPKTAQWLTSGSNSAVAIDDIDILKGLEAVEAEEDKGFFGLRYDDLRRGFANLKRTGSYIMAEDDMTQVSTMAFIDKYNIRDRAGWHQAVKEHGEDANLRMDTQYLFSGDEDRKKLKSDQGSSLLKNISSTSLFAREAAEIPRSIAGEKFAQAESFKEAWRSFTESPLEVATGITTESFAQFAPAIPALFAGLPIAALGAGTTSFANEYVGDVITSMQEAGINVETEEELLSAFSDEKKMEEWRVHATKRGLPIAVIDALSAGIGGRLVEFAKTPVKKAMAGGIEALAIQPALGGAGEIAGAVVAGDEIKGKDVLAEMLGEMAPGIVETTAGVYRNAQIKAETKATESAFETIGEQAKIDEIINYAQSSKTNGRAPEQFEAFVESLGPDREVIIPSEIAEQLEGAPDYIAKQINDLGTSISIPLKKFASEIATNEEWMNIVRPHIKLSENTMTQSELDSGERTELQSLLKKAQEAKETLTEADRIYETVKDQIKATGLQGEATARYSAQLYPAAATVYVEKARKAGHDISISDVFDMMGFKVEAGDIEIDGDPGTILEQAAYKDVPYIFDAARDKFLDVLPEDAEVDEVLETIDEFGPEYRNFIKALERDDWLGFDYPSQAINAALSEELESYEVSPGLKQSIGRMINAEYETGKVFGQAAIPADLEITMESEIIETGEKVQETFNAKELNAEIDDKLDSYKRLRDCLG